MKPERGQIVVTERVAAVPASSRRYRCARPTRATVMTGDPEGGEHRPGRLRPLASAPPEPSAPSASSPAGSAERRAGPESDPRHDAGRLSDLRRIRNASRRLHRVLPFRRHAIPPITPLTIAPMMLNAGALDKSLVAPFSARRFHNSRGWLRRGLRFRSSSTASQRWRASGDTVAVACSPAAGIGIAAPRRSPGPRAPYRMMGVRSDRLVTIDGVGSRQACLSRCMPA